MHLHDMQFLRQKDSTDSPGDIGHSRNTIKKALLNQFVGYQPRSWQPIRWLGTYLGIIDSWWLKADKFVKGETAVGVVHHRLDTNPVSTLQPTNAKGILAKQQTHKRLKYIECVNNVLKKVAPSPILGCGATFNFKGYFESIGA